MEEASQEQLLDSLKRQIEETKKELKHEKRKASSFELELKRKEDNKKAAYVLKSLKLKKQLQELSSFLEESRKQWALDIRQLYNSVQSFATSTAKDQFQKARVLSEVYSLLDSLSQKKPQEDNIQISTMSVESENEDFEQITEVNKEFIPGCNSSTLKRFINSEQTQQVSGENYLNHKVEGIKLSIKAYLEQLKKNELRKEEIMPYLETSEYTHTLEIQKEFETSIRPDFTVDGLSSEDEDKPLSSQRSFPEIITERIDHLREETVRNYLDTSFELEPNKVSTKTFEEEIKVFESYSSNEYSVSFQEEDEEKPLTERSKYFLDNCSEHSYVREFHLHQAPDEVSKKKLASNQDLSKFIQENSFEKTDFVLVKSEDSKKKTWKNLLCPCVFK